MNPSEQVVPIAMQRASLTGLPQYALPAPYSIRWYEPGDEQAWTDIWQRSDRYNVITPEVFAREFGRDEAELRRRQCYLLDGQRNVIGTATAWVPDETHPRNFGRVHWVAIVPPMQGRGLAKPLMSLVLARMQELGYEGAFLTTESPRFTAIRLYLGFGFVPEVRSARERQAWIEIQHELAPSELDTLAL